ncbi:Asp-tRNA(Asn)/Glu-tRNA(Gln) amidotransferase subunit GatC [Candidatus Woesebacteria bacterium]|nr:Asp-tRNA(Asn)/Glu-tRNA(Gln) amidotransferase subunit GatC [Candidatus Woesebacteria bacterium]
MSKKASIPKKNAEHLAKLTNLTLSDDELALYSKQLGETIDYIDNLNELNTKNVQATSHSTAITNVTFEDGTPSVRTLTQQEALKGANHTSSDYFAVNRIIA